MHPTELPHLSTRNSVVTRKTTPTIISLSLSLSPPKGTTTRRLRSLRMQHRSEPPQYDDVPDDGSSPVQPDGEEPEHEKEDKIPQLKRDYIKVRSRPHLMKILHRQGDQLVLFADKVLKFTGSGKMKCRILLITDFAIYIVDPDTDSLKRRIALAAVDKVCLSELSDNFFAVIIPTEYDLLMASARKNEIVAAFVEAIRIASNYDLDVVSSNRFEYNAASDLVKEVEFEEVEGGVKTRILRK